MPDGYKIKKIYVGQDQVRPSINSGPFDLKTMTLADLTAAWFTYSWLNGGNCAIDSTKWFYSTSDGNAVLAYPVDLSNANSVVIKWTYYWISWSRCSWPRAWIGTAIAGAAGQSTLKVLWEMQMNTNSGYKYQAIIIAWTAKKQTDVGSLATGEYNNELTINLSTGAVTWKVWSVATLDYTMTSSELAAAKTCTYLIWVANYNWSKQHQLWSIDWTII